MFINHLRNCNRRSCNLNTLNCEMDKLNHHVVKGQIVVVAACKAAVVPCLDKERVDIGAGKWAVLSLVRAMVDTGVLEAWVVESVVAHVVVVVHNVYDGIRTLFYGSNEAFFYGNNIF